MFTSSKRLINFILKTSTSTLSFLLLLLFLPSVMTNAQGCFKSIRFDETVARSCVVNADGDAEDPAIMWWCDNTMSTMIYASEWAVSISATGTYALPGPWGACNPPYGSNTVATFGPVPDPGTSHSFFFHTFEGDDFDCFDPGDGSDDCLDAGTVFLDLTPGTHFLDSRSGGPVADVGFNYTVTDIPLINSITTGVPICTSPTTYEVPLTVSYNISPSFICGMSGVFGNLEVNGQSFSPTGSPQNITLTGLTPNGLPVDVTAFFDGDFSSCIHNSTALFTAPDASTCALLPLELYSFEVTTGTFDVRLDWEIDKDHNLIGFEIERSREGKNWQTIGDALIHSHPDQRIYSSFDSKPLDGRSYYRLKLITDSGASLYSEIKSVHFAGENIIKLYPNPARDQLQLDLTALETSRFTIKIVDVLGKTVSTYSKNGNSVLKIDLSAFEPGTYLILIHTGEATFRKQFVIVK